MSGFANAIDFTLHHFYIYPVSLMNLPLLVCHLQKRGHDTHSTVTRIYQGEYRDDTVLSEEKALEQIEIWNHAE